MFERDHGAAGVPEGLRRRPRAPLAALPRHRHLSRARRDVTAHGRPPEVLDRADPVPAAGRAARRRHRRADHPARPAVRVRHLVLRGAGAALRAGRAGGRRGARPGRASSSAAGCGSRPRPGWRPATAGWPSSRVAVAPPRPSVVEADLPDTAGRGARAVGGRRVGGARGPRRAPARARRCSCSAPAGSSARSRSRPPGCSGAGRVVAAARSDGRAARGPRHAARTPWSTCAPTTTPPRSAERLREACDGPADVVVDPLFGIPGTAAALVLADGGRLVNLGSAAGAGPVGRLGRPAQPLGRGARLHQQRAHRRAPPGGVRHRPRPRRRRAPRGRPTTSSRSTAHPRPGTRSPWHGIPASSSPPDRTGDAATAGRARGPAPPSDRPSRAAAHGRRRQRRR